MNTIAKIKSLIGFQARTTDKAIELRECVSCGALLEPRLTSVIQGEHRCGCGSLYKVISACADVSQLRNLVMDPKTITANTHHMKCQFGTKTSNAQEVTGE